MDDQTLKILLIAIAVIGYVLVAIFYIRGVKEKKNHEFITAYYDYTVRKVTELYISGWEEDNAKEEVKELLNKLITLKEDET